MPMKMPKITWRWDFAKEDVVLALVAICVVSLGGPLFKRLFTSTTFAFPGEWGQLGDFVGGFLNPLVALAALYMLRQSIQIQRKELAEARDALTGQASSAQASVEIAGYTAAINSAVAQVEIHQTHINYLMTQIHSGQFGAGILSISGSNLSRQEAFDIITGLHGDIGALMKEQAYFSKRLKLTLREMGHSQLD